MAYLDESLGKSEVVVARARLSWLYMVEAGACLLIAAGAVAVSFASGLEHGAAGVVAAAALILGLALFLGIMLPVWTTEVGVTNQRLIVKRGILGRSTEELELWSIEQVDLKQTPLDRVFGFGRLVVSGTGDDAMTLPLICSALSFRKSVQEAINEARPNHQRP